MSSPLRSTIARFVLASIVPLVVLPAYGALAEQCVSDADCVPASCCHATDCVPRAERPSCDGVVCSQECAPNTLDCGGSCVCSGGTCRARVNAFGSHEMGAAPGGRQRREADARD